VNSNLVLGCQGTLGDSLVAVQISKSLDIVHVFEDWKYSLRTWPIGQVYLDGASLHDHELRANYNHGQATAGW